MEILTQGTIHSQKIIHIQLYKIDQFPKISIMKSNICLE